MIYADAVNENFKSDSGIKREEVIGLVKLKAPKSGRLGNTLGERKGLLGTVGEV